MLTRIEYNVTTMVVAVTDQIAYRNKEGDVIVLDAIDPTPDGYEEFDHSELTKEE